MTSWFHFHSEHGVASTSCGRCAFWALTSRQFSRTRSSRPVCSCRSTSTWAGWPSASQTCLERLVWLKVQWLVGSGLLYSLGVPLFVKNGQTLCVPGHTLWHFLLFNSALAHSWLIIQILCQRKPVPSSALPFTPKCSDPGDHKGRVYRALLWHRIHHDKLQPFFHRMFLLATFNIIMASSSTFTLSPGDASATVDTSII